MTIKQQGGIFGRNPTFNEVDATDITTESLSLLKNNPFVRLDDSDTDNNGEFRLDNTSVRIEADKDNAVAGSKIKFKIDNSEIGFFDENGHLDIDGNLVVASGQGIDFSATSDATGSTSELFSDYEQGNWTPTYSPATGSFTTIPYDGATSGVYTKIGDTVHIVARVRTDATISVGTASGALRVGGLPYTGTGVASFSVWSRDFGGDNPSEALLGGDVITLYYRTAANGTADNPLDVSDLNTGSNNKNDVIVSGWYKVA